MAASWKGSPLLLNFERRHSYAKPGGQFKATQMWNELIEILRHRVDVKRRRYLMKYYDDCFTGSDAVDVMLRHLLDEGQACGKEISRENAIKLCQTFMDNNIFEPVCSKASSSEEKKPTFEDSSNKFYKFIEPPDSEYGFSDENIDEVDTDMMDNHEVKETLPRKDTKMRIHKEVEPDLIDGEGVYSNPVVVNRQGQVLQEIINIKDSIRKRSSDISDSMKRKSRDFVKKNFTPDVFRSPPKIAWQGNQGTPLSDCLKKRRIPAEVKEELFREAALAKLLTIIDLPMLDGILMDASREKKATRHNTVIFNTGHASPCYIGSERPSDPWIKGALSLLDHIPAGISVLTSLANELMSAEEQKWRLFQTLAGHYSAMPQPLLSDKCLDLYVGIIKLISEGKRSGLEALQLSMLLLPTDIRAELKKLLKFMQVAASDGEMKLDPKLSNREAVNNIFTGAVFKCKLLAPQPTSLLVMFMMDNCDAVFTTPKDIKFMVMQSLQQMKGSEMDPVVAETFTYCDRVTQEEYKKQMEDYTEQCLRKIMDGILDDTSISLKEKKSRVKQFQRHHPYIFNKFFSDLKE
ncbi:DEP domain-containing protein 7 [Lingula anatina]|uniref:DEP domain-containing protein 7 n=1 Tax=Lingula anatina TaxID=7574 RepID=A0A1S3IC49_LINAN|nr:DEP domain-containing protein 7 [Lingula anatina]|eukprot:XP_013395436.1 DEP domain-containing protein 7 [Lingula anatina]